MLTEWCGSIMKGTEDMEDMEGMEGAEEMILI